MHPILVQKYGGSSVADVEKIQRVAARVARTRESGKRVVVVVSAMGDTTDELLALARKVSPDPHRRELDMLLTAGERISMALLGMALHARGVEAVSFTGSQSGIITDGAHTNARILEVRPVRILEELARGRVVIVAGYQGVSREREVTTLGRGGSDTTAVALAAALEAEACEICSDVDGVFTADPRLVPAARKLLALSHEEMQELSLSGAKVLNAQAVEFARDKGIAIHALSTFGPGTGTRIAARVPSEQRELRVSGVALEPDLLVLRGAGGAAELEQLGALLSRHGAWPRELWADDACARALVPLENVHGLAALLSELRARAPRVVVEEGQAQVSVVGTGIGASREPLARALQALPAPPAGVRVLPLRLALLVPRAAGAECLRRLHAEFIEKVPLQEQDA
ncbi:MAG TPA: aspartate kinase [Myxococcales bacterium]|nr:aspartate kinase [Myxococcales bacterium]